MIEFLTGRVARKGADRALIEVGGVGYGLAMTTSSLAALPAEGDEVTVWTHLHVREDDLSLFGFENEAEKDAFGHLITVSGVGPKVALSTLSALSPDALASAIATEDVVTISSVPGIGKKTAQRIILDLKDRLGVGGALSASKAPGVASGFAEATDALLAMGFSAAEVAVALKGADDVASDSQALLRHALKRLGG